MSCKQSPFSDKIEAKKLQDTLCRLLVRSANGGDPLVTQAQLLAASVAHCASRGHAVDLAAAALAHRIQQHHSVAAEAFQRMAEFHEIEAEIRGKTPPSARPFDTRKASFSLKC
jgi:hypothetical protein